MTRSDFIVFFCNWFWWKKYVHTHTSRAPCKRTHEGSAIGTCESPWLWRWRSRTPARTKLPRNRRLSTAKVINSGLLRAELSTPVTLFRWENERFTLTANLREIHICAFAWPTTLWRNPSESTKKRWWIIIVLQLPLRVLLHFKYLSNRSICDMCVRATFKTLHTYMFKTYF